MSTIDRPARKGDRVKRLHRPPTSHATLTAPVGTIGTVIDVTPDPDGRDWIRVDWGTEDYVSGQVRREDIEILPPAEEAMTDQFRTELLRLINERGVVDLDAEDLANDVTQLFQPDGPGCWAEDESGIQPLRFVRFNETNQHEGETWTFWLQVNGNEDQLDKLWNLLIDAAQNEDGETDEDFSYDLADRTEETLPEEHVDVLVKHAAGDGYRAAHEKVVGKFVCPDSLGDGADDLYKGKITKLFTGGGE